MNTSIPSLNIIVEILAKVVLQGKQIRSKKKN